MRIFDTNDNVQTEKHSKPLSPNIKKDELIIG